MGLLGSTYSKDGIRKMPGKFILKLSLEGIKNLLSTNYLGFFIEHVYFFIKHIIKNF